MQSKAWMIISLVITCAVAALALSWVYGATKPTIENQRVESTRSALIAVMPAADSFAPIIPDSLWYGLDTAGGKLGIVFRSGERGYGGPVPVLVGLDPGGKIIGIKIASGAEGLKETPGLGQKAVEEWFWKQFLGADSTVALRIDGGAVDAISGATITSRAVAKGIAGGIRRYSEHLKP